MRNAHVAWSFSGLALPLCVAAATIPSLLDRLGPERFGMLTLAWGVIGYASVLDLGVGRAVTHRVAVARSSLDRLLIPDILASALRLTWRAGCAALAIVVLAAMWGAHTLVAAGPVLEIRASVAFVGLALVLQAMCASYRGVSEAYLAFRGLSVLRILLGVANFAGPLLVSFYTVSLHWVIATLVVSRGLALWGYALLARRALMRDGLGNGRPRDDLARELLEYGGWFAVSGVVGALIVQSDRFVIGAVLGAAAVTAYVLPYEIVVQGLVLVSAVAAVAFPALSHRLLNDPPAARSLFRLWQGRALLAMGVTMAGLAWIMPDLLRLWLGGRLPAESVLVARILCLGVFFNAIGVMYFSLLHALGATKATGVLHLIELPLYVFLMLLLIQVFGIAGAAAAWLLRAFLDAGMLAYMAERRLKLHESLYRQAL